MSTLLNCKVFHVDDTNITDEKGEPDQQGCEWPAANARLRHIYKLCTELFGIYKLLSG